VIPRGVKFAHVALLVFSALLAFLVLRAIDEEAVLGTSAMIEVTQSDNSVASDRVIGMVESFADARGVNVVHEVADLEDPGNRRHLYMAVGDPDDPSASWLANGYPSFSRDFRTDVHPIGEISHLDPRGYYLVFGPPEAAGELIGEFEKLGFGGQVAPGITLTESILYFANSNMLWCFLIVLLAAMIVIGASVVLNAKTYGVLRLQGKSFAEILLRDMAQLATFWIRAAPIAATGIVACLALYNGLNRLWTFAAIAAGLLAVFTLVALFAHVLALALTYGTKIVYAIKGEVSATLAMVGAYGIRIPAALIALAIVVSAVTTWQEVAAQQASRDAFARVGDASTVLLWGNPSVEKELNSTVGPWIQQSQSQGEVILALRSDMMEFTPVGERIPDRDVLIVNNAYLAEQTVLDASGERLHGVRDSGTKAQILLPESLSGEEDRFIAMITDWLKFQAEVSGVRLEAAQVEKLRTRSDQTLFTYGSGMDPEWQKEALIRDPIIIVVPGGSGILDDGQYVAYASQAGVVFKDPEHVRAAMSTDVGRYVIAMSPVARTAADQYQELIREFRLDLFNIAVALAVLLITSVSVSLIYCRKNAQALFVKYISGWTFARAYRSLLILEGTLALSLVGWISWNTWKKVNALRELEAEGIPPVPGEAVALGGWAPAVMFAIVALGAAVVIVTTLTGSHSRSVRAVEE
jgi:hypothetical protein